MHCHGSFLSTSVRPPPLSIVRVPGPKTLWPSWSGRWGPREIKGQRAKGPKGQTVVTSRWSRWSRWYLIVVLLVVYIVIYIVFLPTPFLGWKQTWNLWYLWHWAPKCNVSSARSTEALCSILQLLWSKNLPPGTVELQPGIQVCARWVGSSCARLVVSWQQTCELQRVCA